MVRKDVCMRSKPVRVTNDLFSFQTGLMYWPFVQVSFRVAQRAFLPHRLWSDAFLAYRTQWEVHGGAGCAGGRPDRAWSTNRALSPSAAAVQLPFGARSPANSLLRALWLCLGHLPLLFPAERRWHGKVSLDVAPKREARCRWRIIREIRTKFTC